LVGSSTRASWPSGSIASGRTRATTSPPLAASEKSRVAWPLLSLATRQSWARSSTAGKRPSQGWSYGTECHGEDTRLPDQVAVCLAADAPVGFEVWLRSDRLAVRRVGDCCAQSDGPGGRRPATGPTGGTTGATARDASVTPPS